MQVEMKSIGERIRDRRKELRLTQNDIKSACGISSGALSEIENGNRTPSIIIFHSLSEVLNCSMDWLATGKNPDAKILSSSVSEDIETDMECKLLNGFRELPPDEKDELLEILELKLRKVKRDGRKMEKLYNLTGEDDDTMIG